MLCYYHPIELNKFPLSWTDSHFLVDLNITCLNWYVRWRTLLFFILHSSWNISVREMEKKCKDSSLFLFPFPRSRSLSCLYHKNMYIFVASGIIVAHRRMCIECLVLSKNTTAGYWFIFFFLLFQNIVCWCISLFVSSSVYLEVKNGRKNICAKLVVFQRFQHGNF